MLWVSANDSRHAQRQPRSLQQATSLLSRQYVLYGIDVEHLCRHVAAKFFNEQKRG
jgi:hypothetical protein